MENYPPPVAARTALQALLASAEIKTPQLLKSITLTGSDPIYPSSYCIGTAAQTSIAAATLAASQIWQTRNNKTQNASVDMRHAALEFRSERYQLIDGKPPPELWDKIAGVYQTGDQRWIRLHTNFPHHREGILDLLECDYTRNSVTAALLKWQAQNFEDQAAEKSLLPPIVTRRCRAIMMAKDKIYPAAWSSA